MRRPPDRKSPPILFARPTHEWINRVDQQLKRLGQLRLSTDQQRQIARWLKREFVHSTLLLEGIDISRERVDESLSASLGDSDSGLAATNERESAVASLARSLRKLESLVQQSGESATLTPDFLIELHSIPGAFRRSDAHGATMSVPPEHLPAALVGACQWFTADSFVELNPIEQAAIVLLRFVELEPFEQLNERTALVAASLFTMRRQLPPIIVRPEKQTAYRAALDEGLQMNTKPMVEFVAESVETSLRAMIQQVGGGSPSS